MCGVFLLVRTSRRAERGMDDDANDRRWDVGESRRPRRANRGNLMQELLEKGLNSEEESLLNALSDATSDSTFSGSGGEATDEIDSDFSDEEVEGVLDGAAVQTEAMVRREERRERRAERRRGRGGGVTGAAAPLRLRPPPTIPQEERMRAARKRAREVRAATAAAAGTAAASSTGAAGTDAAKRRRGHHKNRTRASETPALEEDGGEVSQRVLYTSSRSVLEKFGVPVVISFSTCLPRLFSRTVTP